MSEGVWVDYPVEVEWEGIALVAGAGMEVVEILNKRRTPPSRMDVRIRFARAAQPPRRLTAIQLLFRVATDSPSSQVARAVELSVQKYCSVVHSLKEDIDISWEVEVEAPQPASG